MNEIWFALMALALSLGKGAEDLVERLQRREPEALAELFDRFGKLVYSVIYAIVHDSAAAEDLVQETFLRVWNRVRGFDAERGAIGPWLLAIARNRAIDYLRSASARVSLRSSDLDEVDSPALFVDMEQDLLTANRVNQVRSAMSRLNENQRKVIELAYFEGLSQSEMADHLQQPLGTVKTWVRSALKLLRDELEVAIA